MTARIRVRDSGGTLRTLTRIRARDSGGTLRTLTRIRVGTQNNVLRVVYDTTGASSFAATADHSRSGSGNGTATTTTVVVTPTGGTAPYFHAWTLISPFQRDQPDDWLRRSGHHERSRRPISGGRGRHRHLPRHRDGFSNPGEQHDRRCDANFFDTSTL
jgi:hypothetical protein